MEEIRTFKSLYEYLQNLNNINELLNTKYSHIEIQESLLRLFAKLECIKAFDDYTVCNGNFNLQEINKISNYNEIFYNNNNNEIKLKDNGDISDLTMISKDNKTLIATTSKNYSKKTISYKELDLLDIIQRFKSYNNKFENTIICICLKSKNQLLNYNPNKTSQNKSIKKHLDNCILLDHEDLINAFEIFKMNYNNKSINDLLNFNKISYRPHQLYTINKTIEYLENYNNILWGHMPRSGKTYIMAGLISKLNTNKNYLIITTSPNETINQYINVLNNLQDNEFNVVLYKKNIKLKENKNIIIVSKQTLDHKNNKNLKFNNIDIIFIDETHYGGTTELSKNILNSYKDTKKIFITATFNKVNLNYKIDKIINWDLEDIKYCKTDNLEALESKHNGIMKYFQNDYKNIYSIFPELHIMGIDLENDLRKKINNNNLNWDFESLFELVPYEKTNNEKLDKSNKDNSMKFLNKELIIEYFKYILHDSIIKIDNKKEQRLIYNYDEPSVIMCFLPSNNVNIISQNLKPIISDIDPDIEICICNTIDNNERIKTNISKSLQTAKNTKKKTVLVLSGVQGSLGITIPECDLVLLMNNSKSNDFIFQSMFRCMTESKNKKTGYVIDLNVERIIYGVITYCNYNFKNYKEHIKHIINNDIIKISFNNDFTTYDKNILIEKIYNYYTKYSSTYIDYSLNLLNYRNVILSNDQYKKIQTFLFTNKKSSKVLIHDDNKENDTIKLNNSKSITIISSNESEVVNNNNKQNYIITLKNIIPLLCILTIHDDTILDYNAMINYIKSNSILYNILINQFTIWWSYKMSIDQFDYLTSLFNELNLDQDKEIINIIETIKNLFINSKSNYEELSKLIDKYLVPQEIEKKKNAEVSTPYKLRQEMLDTIPVEFWSTKQKVFEPCCGKGGFVVDIYNRFVKNSSLSKKEILEECIYFADINPINIFITKLLLDPNNEYNLNYYEGDTLKIDIFKEWNINGFDAVIGNPPYNLSGAVNTGNTIWQFFVKESLNKWIKKNGYLCFVHPAGWRKPNSKKSKFNDLFKLMTKDNTMLKLTIRGLKDGNRVFNCGTRYDYYLIQYIPNNNYLTYINDEDYNIHYINLSEWEFLPNKNYIFIKNIITRNSDDQLSIIYSANLYETRKKYVNKDKTYEFQYPLIHSTPKTGIRYMYSSIKDKGHFGISKIIFGDSGFDYVIIDNSGMYGMTQHAIGIKIDNIIEAKNYKKALESKLFNNVLNSCSWSNYQIDWRLFTYIKKDFWKEFINEEA
jgi:hypothetical protein